MTRVRGRPWLPAEVERVIHMREVERKVWSVIDRALKRAPGSSAAKYEAMRRGPMPGKQFEAGSRIELSADQVADRLARKEAANRMTLTAAVLGDPPPGFSALDRRDGR